MHAIPISHNISDKKISWTMLLQWSTTMLLVIILTPPCPRPKSSDRSKMNWQSFVPSIRSEPGMWLQDVLILAEGVPALRSVVEEHVVRLRFWVPRKGEAAQTNAYIACCCDYNIRLTCNELNERLQKRWHTMAANRWQHSNIIFTTSKG